MSTVNPDKVGNSNTEQTFLSALVLNAGIFGVEVVAFVILKQRLGRIYSPRSYLPPPDKRAEELPAGIWRWIPAILLTPLPDIIHKNGLDAYMFLRFLKMLVWIFLVFTLLTFAVLLPVDAAGVKDSDGENLDRLSWENISSSFHQSRYSAHIAVAWILTFFVIYMIRRELMHFVTMRHRFLVSKQHSRSAQARTVLITNVPEDLADEKALRTYASFIPGGVDRVWIYRDTKALNKLFDERLNACKKLEAATSKLLKQATKASNAKKALAAKRKGKNEVTSKTGARVPVADVERGKAHVEHAKSNAVDEHVQRGDDDGDGGGDPDNGNGAVGGDLEQGNGRVATVNTSDEAAASKRQESRDLLDSLVAYAKRPKHRTGPLGIVGRKVDTIEYLRDEIARLNREISELREHIVAGKFLGSVFIRCNLQMGAHILAQCVPYHAPFAMYGRFIETHPRDIVWANIDDGVAEAGGRKALSWIATVVLIFGWAAPVAFAGTLSNIQSLCSDAKWLAWICKAPAPVPGIITGVLPPLLLAVLFILLPFALHALAWFECIPRYSQINISVYRRYFLFLVLNGFLIVTLTSGITAVIEQIIHDPKNAVEDLAQRLPSAAIFFLTYMVTQGLSGAGSALIQLAALVLHYIQKWLLGRTPRQAFSVRFLMPAVNFGTTLPRMSLLATIAFSYSVISPIINALAMLSFLLFFFAYKFLFTWVFDQPDEFETGGMYFPMAISNLFVGLYIEQICLAVLFYMNVTVAKVSSLVEGSLMIVLILITFIAQRSFMNAFDPISKYLPMSLATKDMARRFERRKKRHMGITDKIEEEVDMFSREHMQRIRKRLKLLPSHKEEGKTPEMSEPATGAPALATPGIGTPVFEGIPDLFRQASQKTVRSRRSKSSVKAKSTEHGHRKVPDPEALTTEAEQHESSSDSDSDSDTDSASNGNTAEDLDEHAFDHPSTYIDQAWVWVPRDVLGISTALVKDLKSAGVDASDVGATMDEKGIVEVNRGPPDEEWTGGMDR